MSAHRVCLPCITVPRSAAGIIGDGEDRVRASPKLFVCVEA